MNVGSFTVQSPGGPWVRLREGQAGPGFDAPLSPASVPGQVERVDKCPSCIANKPRMEEKQDRPGPVAGDTRLRYSHSAKPLLKAETLGLGDLILRLPRNPCVFIKDRSSQLY